MAKALRVCYFGTYRSKYSRNQIMIEGLQQAGADVVICHETLWQGIEDRIQIVNGGWKNPKFWFRVLRTYTKLVARIVNVKKFDILVVGYPGQFDVFLAWIICRLKRKPLVWDIFMSIYLIAKERGLDKKNRSTIQVISHFEKLACHLPDLLILDTEDYAQWFQSTYYLPIEKIKLVPTGADDRIFFPLPKSSCDHHDFRILYYGTYIPNHGVIHIIEAAKLLKDNPLIQFELIGNGPDRKIAQNLVNLYDLSNIKFSAWMEQSELVKRINCADICLGVFGKTKQSMMTIQNKIYECLASAKPVLSGDSLAIRRALLPERDILLCERANPKALAESILYLYQNTDIRNELAVHGYETFFHNYSISQVGRQFFNHLLQIFESRAS